MSDHRVAVPSAKEPYSQAAATRGSAARAVGASLQVWEEQPVEMAN